MQRAFIAMVLILAIRLAAEPVAPIPEDEQAARALKILDAYHGARPAEPPKKLYIVYFTPADREPAARYEERLEPILEDIRTFYREGMTRLGFGSKTFALERDGQGKLVIHLVKGKEAGADFPRWVGRNNGNTGAPAGGDMVRRDCAPVLGKAGISLDHETSLIFCQLAIYDEKAGTFRHWSPYYGVTMQQGGLCFAADWAAQDLANLTKNEPRLNDGEYGDMSLGKHMTIFIGGIAHELGHAFSLPHCGERWDEQRLGTSIMGWGNHTYHDEARGEGKGSFLPMASAMRLAGRPLFNGSAKDEAQRGQLEHCSLDLSTNLMRADLAKRPAGLRLEGNVKGLPPIYGVIAYFDSMRGSQSAYHAPAATSVPDEQGRFAIEVSDLTPCGNGELRVEFCHANGAVSTRRLGFSVSAEHAVDLTQWETRGALQPVAEAVGREDREAAQAALGQMQKGSAPEFAKVVARKLVATLNDEPRLAPNKVPARTRQFSLGDAQAESAETGWLKPMVNRVPMPANDPVSSPLLDAGSIYATGLFAHAPSRYVFNLGGKWKKLSGEAGLHVAHQPYGSVVFIIKTNEHEAFRSPVIRGAKKAKYDLEVTGVKKLELIVDPSEDGKHNDWGLWLEPMLVR